MTTYAILFLILIFNVILKIPYINIPIDRDYGIYGYHALFWLRGDKKPYVDTQENHPPGRWLLYALLLKFFPQSRKIFRISNLFFLIATNILVFLITAHLFGITIGLVSAGCFAILSSLPIFVWTQSSDEVQQILFSSLAVLLVLTVSETTVGLYYVIGIISFLTVFYKQSAYVNTFPLIGCLLLIENTSLLSYFLLGVGVLTGYSFAFLFFKYQEIPTKIYKLIFVLDLSAAKSIVSWLKYKNNNEQNTDSDKCYQDSEGGPPSNNADTNKTSDSNSKSDFWAHKLNVAFINQTFFFLNLCMIALVYSIFGSNEISKIYPVILWLVFCFGTIWLNKHRMPIHFIPLLPPLAILSGYGVINGLTWVENTMGIQATLTGFIIAVGLTVFYMKNEVIDNVNLEKKGRGHMYFHDQEWEFSTVGERVGKYLAQITSADDQIYVWGSEHEIYYWACRSSPTHTLFCPRSGVSYSPDPVGMEKDIIKKLKLQIPKYIVITALLDENQMFSEFLAENYSMHRKMYGEIEIHRRKDLQQGDQVVTVSVQKPLVSIIILTWNALDYTRQCIESIRVNTNHPHEIIFVDNASNDGTREYLNELVKNNDNYYLIANNENRGFAAGNNQGMSIAKGKYILLLNNDVLVPEGWLERLVRCAEMDSSIGLVGPLTNQISGLQMIANVTYSNPDDSYEYARRIAQAHKQKYTPRRRLAGFAMMINRKLYEQIDGLDESFGSGNYEDDDYCLRAAEAGYKIMVAEDVFIHHFGSVSFSANQLDYSNAINHNYEIFKGKWPQIDVKWLMEKEQTVVELNDQLSHAGELALNNHQIDEAIEIYQRILKTNPIDIRALYGLGIGQQLKENFDLALNYFTMVAEIIPEYGSVHTSIAVIHAHYENYDQAVTSLNRAIELEPNNIDTKVYLAKVLLANDQAELGIYMLKAVLKDDPQHIDGLNQMGLLLLSLGRGPKARKYFDIVLQLDPADKLAMETLARINSNETV
ncbi:glycosyltransferase [candidate division KSB1 bacterium]|nr:glycosyltransferase [candidate division KSB1 bacterium]